MTTWVKCKRMREGASIPMRKTLGACAFDLESLTFEPLNDAALVERERVVLLPGGAVKVASGVAFEMSNDLLALVRPRSSSICRGLWIDGTIDSDYRGEVFVLATNVWASERVVMLGERIAQLLFLPKLTVQLVEASALDATDRGAKGFGSTGA